MPDDYEDLLHWVARVHGVAVDPGSEETVMRRVVLHEGQVRDAARDLSFEAEPARYRFLLEGPAKGPRR